MRNATYCIQTWLPVCQAIGRDVGDPYSVGLRARPAPRNEARQDNEQSRNY
jgi:hypothetical protein